MGNAEHDPLWARIREVSLDDPDARLNFSRRLARENGWPRAYSSRVIQEYMRFCYLALRAGHPVTPSDEVDQAWHLHLTYSRSYWIDFCGGVLEAPLHHGPTRGGAAEDTRYWQQYTATLASYQRLFGEVPPDDIWPAPEARFLDAAQFRRINTAKHWVIPKPTPTPTIRWGLTALVGSPVLAAGIALAADDGGFEIDKTFIVAPLLILLVAFVLKVFWGPRSKNHRRSNQTSDNNSSGGGGLMGCGGGYSGGGDSGCGGGGCGGGD